MPAVTAEIDPSEEAAREAARLAELHGLGLLDTDPDERFDRVTRLAQRLFDVPIALVSLVDVDRQWFKSAQGLEVRETPREHAFCAHAIDGEEVLHVPDATLDPRFSDNPLVTGDPDIRFYAGHPISGPSGAKLGTLCIIDRQARSLTEDDKAALRDLAEVVEREIAALHLAAVDPLTGLRNRRSFETSASKILEVCRRRGVAATLLYLDLDGFKEVNDTQGHDAGDAVLVSVARVLCTTFRVSDVIARLGGDEFAVLLPGSGQAEAEEAVARLQAGFAAASLAVSVGAATMDPAGADDDLAELQRRADEAMYAAKRAGRPA
jgi:diguanylate cyclase (GGDEF)-like protein